MSDAIRYADLVRLLAAAGVERPLAEASTLQYNCVHTTLGFACEDCLAAVIGADRVRRPPTESP